MVISGSSAPLDQDKLLEIIRVQTEISQAPLELERVMEIVVRTASRLCTADGAVVELLEGEHMVYRAVDGLASGQLGLRIPRAGSLSGLCVSEAKVLLCEDSELDGRVNREACRAVGLRSMVVVPLICDGEAVGALKVLKSVPNGFGPPAIQLLDLVSGLVSARVSQAIQYRSREDRAEALLQVATHDALTGLHNRSAFYERLRQELDSSRRFSDSLGVVMIDMDGLKRINDGLGHRAGDVALTALAARLKADARSTDFAARLGGDEFGLILPRLDASRPVAGLAARIAENLRQTVPFDGGHLSVDASVGIAVFPDDGTDVERLFGVADEAMYAMKRARKAERRD